MEKMSPPPSIVQPSDEENKSPLPADSVMTEVSSKDSETPRDSSSNPPQPAGKDDPGRISLEELDEIAQRAKINAFIAVDGLIRIMAQEEDYTEEVYSRALPVLWDKYHMDRIWRKEEIRIASFGNRYEVWQALLYRWSGIQVDKKDFEPPYLNLYKIKHPPGTYEKAAYQGEPGLCYISLDELKAFLGNICPDKLFPIHHQKFIR